MDSISQLSDELLLKILSLLPTANDVLGTMILSKRWQFLWRMVPKLVYNSNSYTKSEYARFCRFVDRSLIMHEAPVIETLHFSLGETCRTDDIRVWIRAADKLNVRELIFGLCSYSSILPRSFYTGCRMLVRLNLRCVTLVDVFCPISFPSLKKLSLLSVRYPSADFLRRFLSNCPVLDDMVFEQCLYDNVSTYTVRVPSLKSLSVSKGSASRVNAHGFVIDTPSLVRLKITDFTDGFFVIENEMPKIVTVDVAFLNSTHQYAKILGSVTSVKCLRLSSSTKMYRYSVGSVFHQLVSLTLCICDKHWLRLLFHMLEDSPKLRTLTLKENRGILRLEPSPSWTNPSSVPECLLSSLEILEWGKYGGAEEEKELVEYILRNGACLKKVTISSKSTDSDKKLEMLKELTLSFRRSPTCQLAFK